MAGKLKLVFNPLTGQLDYVSAGSGSTTIKKAVPCDAGVNVGDFVYIDATETAQQAIATSTATANVVGIVIAKPSVSTANIESDGIVDGVLTGLTAPNVLFLSATTPGGVTTTPPATGNVGQVRLRLGRVLSADCFELDKGTGIIQC